MALLILAAGGSIRMGEPKQLLPLGDSTILGTVIETAKKSGVKNCYCVLGANASMISSEITEEGIEFIYNPLWEVGLASSIKAGVEHLQKLENPPEAILIVLADQPKITTAHLNQFISIANANKNCIVAASYEDKKGVPALFPAVFYDKLLSLEGDKGASNMLNSEAVDLIGIPLEKALFDIDTMADYKAFLKTQNV